MVYAYTGDGRQPEQGQADDQYPGVNPPPNTAEYQRANYGDYTTNEERERQIAEQQWAMQQEAERAAYQQQAAQQAAQQVAQTAPPRQVREKNTPAWLEAWQDPMAGADAFSPCICTADLAGDGEFRLVVATASKKMKVWNGTSLTSEHDLLEPPVAVCTFYPAEPKSPKRPSLAIAAGTHVYIYRNLRPYYKFTLPALAVDEQEMEVWKMTRDGQLSPNEAWDELANLRDAGVSLTSRSLDLLAMEDDGAGGGTVDGLRTAYCAAQAPEQLQHFTSITCMGSVRKNMDEWDATSCLFVGTESAELYVLNANGSAVKHSVKLPSAPVFVASTGLLDVDYRIVVACRDGRVYTVKNDELSTVVIELETQPCGLIRTAKQIHVACMNRVIHCYHAKGKKAYSLYLPAEITCMESMEVTRTRAVRCLLVALANNELRVYNEKHVVSKFDMMEPVRGLRFGRMGREDNTLILCTRGGNLQVKIMPRLANLEAVSQNGPPPEQDIPLAVPKKTKLYVEQTQREREQAVDMHQAFQRDLLKLRLNTARAYVKILKDGQSPVNESRQGVTVRLQASVQGLGPLFKIRVHVVNTGTEPVYDVPIAIVPSKPEMYELEEYIMQCPALLPGLPYIDAVKCRQVDPTSGASEIRVIVCTKTSPVPLITGLIKMPLSEFMD
jgi:Bardet-Biedl syndrome 1 protein|tara:strand:+ start:312 stop:2318 length:2007 start_codon:yes stop_codon:yes gene_type:complete